MLYVKIYGLVYAMQGTETFSHNLLQLTAAMPWRLRSAWRGGMSARRVIIGPQLENSKHHNENLFNSSDIIQT